MLFKLGNWGIGFILAIAMSATPALATTWIVPDADSMAESADAVVLATVESIRGIESFDGSEITTAVTLHVKEGYKGAVAGERLVLHEVGGQVGGNTQWAFGSPEYEVGATVVAYVERTGLNRLRTKHMAIGKLDAEIRDDGEVVLSGVGRHGTVRRESLNSFRRSIPNRARARGSVRVAGRLQAQEPRVEGIAQATTTFRLLQPASRWFSFPVSVFGDLAGDSKLGKAVANRVVEEGSEVWADQMGSEFTAEYKGNRQGKGFTCNSGFTSVSFDDPKNQIGNPTGCAGALAVGGFCSLAGAPSSAPNSS